MVFLLIWLEFREEFIFFCIRTSNKEVLGSYGAYDPEYDCAYEYREVCQGESAT